MIKQYAVFAGEDYYPLGGFRDLKASFDSIEEANDYVNSGNFDWSHIVDTTTFEIVG